MISKKYKYLTTKSIFITKVSQGHKVTDLGVIWNDIYLSVHAEQDI